MIKLRNPYLKLFILKNCRISPLLTKKPGSFYQGNGFAYEATMLLLEFAFEKLEAHKVVGMCNCNNLQSAKLMEKLGMRREGTFREELMWNNQWHDQYFYSILAREVHQ
nr:GNAT family protein [Paenibacillus favisporus]